ncbi:MAG: asparagine synthase (glutamine-hydrolyzing) [Alphaproteobacteria bacterium]
MCGVFGMFLSRPLREDDIALGRQGNELLAHRGPDGQGEFFDIGDGVYLGHRRLRIIDLSERAKQPMTRGKTTICYNGEIYNYAELGADLAAAGVCLGTSSDTEVLLQGWLHWGPAVLDRLDGMFAFALWDGATGILAADLFGEKPLYYSETEDGVYAASEIKVLAELLGSAQALDESRLAAFMALGFVPAPETAYRGIKRVMPGTYLIVQDGKISKTVKYWTTPSGEPGRGPVQQLSEKALDRIQEALVLSVSRRLVSDVPLCLFGSSGVDSSLVAGIIGRDLGADIEMLTIRFKDTAVDESVEAAAMARDVGVEHRIVDGVAQPQDVGWNSLLDLFGQPNDNMSILASLQLAEVARENGYVVGLVGSGGDEAFYGYLKQQFFWRHRRIMALPEPVRLASRIMSPLAPFSSRIRLFLDLVAVPDGERYIAVKNQPAYRALKQIPSMKLWAKYAFAETGTPLEFEVPRIERDCVLPGSQLDSLDLGSMHVGVELRTPFLSRGLFELLANYDPRSFLAFGQKSIGRRLVARYLPKSGAANGKKGFVFPLDQLLAASMREPSVAGLPATVSSEIWKNRFSGSGWGRLAVRLAQADAFVNRTPA